MEITYELEKEDFRKFRWYFLIVNPPKSFRNQSRFLLGFVIAIGIHRFLLSGQQYPLVNRIWGLIIWVVLYSLGFYIIRRLASLYIIRQDLPKSGVICQHTITLTETELIEKTDVNEEHCIWESLEGIEEINDYFFIFISPERFHVIPKRAFETTSEYDAFSEFVKNKISQTTS